MDPIEFVIKERVNQQQEAVYKTSLKLQNKKFLRPSTVMEQTQ